MESRQGECCLIPVWRTIFRGALHAQRPSIADSFQNNMYTTPGQIPFSLSWAFLIILNGSYSGLWRSRKLTLLILPGVMARETRQTSYRFYSRLGSSFLIITALARTFCIVGNLPFIVLETHYPLETQLRLLLKGSCSALKGCVSVSVSRCSFAQFSCSCLIFRFFLFF